MVVYKKSMRDSVMNITVGALEYFQKSLSARLKLYRAKKKP